MKKPDPTGIDPDVVKACREAAALLRETGRAEPVLFYGQTGVGKDYAVEFPRFDGHQVKSIGLPLV